MMRTLLLAFLLLLPGALSTAQAPEKPREEMIKEVEVNLWAALMSSPGNHAVAISTLIAQMIQIYPDLKLTDFEDALRKINSNAYLISAPAHAGPKDREGQRFSFRSFHNNCEKPRFLWVAVRGHNEYLATLKEFGIPDAETNRRLLNEETGRIVVNSKGDSCKTALSSKGHTLH